MQEALKESIEDASRETGVSDLAGDLWPRMRARLDAPARRPPFADWVLAVAIVTVMLLFPQLILGVLYHL
jgi:hypothetical protein